jgi:HEAT repeat protein
MSRPVVFAIAAYPSRRFARDEKQSSEAKNDLKTDSVIATGKGNRMTGEQVCPHCGAGVKPAMLKCYDCGECLKDVGQVVTAGQSVGAATSRTASASSGRTARTVSRSTGPRIIGASGPMRVRDYSQPMPSRVPARNRNLAPQTEASTTLLAESSVDKPLADEDSRDVARPLSPEVADRPPEAREVADDNSANDVVVEVCSCGSRIRVPAAWAGRRKKCRRCGAVIGGSSDSKNEPAKASRHVEVSDEVRRLIQELLTDIAARPGESALTRTASSRVLKKLEARLQIKEPLDRDEAVQRRAAVLELGQTRDVRAVELLGGALQDASEAVRQGVATAAGTLADPAALPIALRLLEDSVRDVVSAAISATRECGDVRVVPLLLKFGLQDPALRLLTREAIAGLGDAAVPALLTAMQGIDQSVVPEAVITAGRIGNPQAVPALLNALDHTSGSVRSSVVEALGRIGDSRAVGPLVQLLAEPDEHIQTQAAAALIRCPDTRCVRPLLGILQQTRNADLRRNATRALAATKDPRAVPAISRLLDESDETLREVATEALGAIGDRTACGALLKLLRGDSPSLVLKAMAAMRKVATAEAVPALIPLVQHFNPSIRRQAVEILGDLRPDDAFDLFAELLENDQSAEVRTAAARGLGKLKDRQAIRLLEQALRDEPTVRCAAVMGLTTIGDAEAIPALLATLKDATPVVRYHAVTGLGKLKADQAATAIRRLLEDKDAMVRTGAEKALTSLGISKPTLPLKRRLAAMAGRIVPNSLVGVVPGGVLTIAAVPCLLGLLTAGWYFQQNTQPNNELAIAQALFSTADVSDIAWTDSTEQVAVLRTDGSVDFWNAATGEFVERQKLPRPVQLARAATTRPNALVLFSLGGQCRVGRWEVSSGTQGLGKLAWTPFKGRIQSASASADGSVLLAVTSPTKSVVWNVADGTEVAGIPFKSHPQPAISADGKLAAGVVVPEQKPQQPMKSQPIFCLYSTETGEKRSEISSDSLANIQNVCFSEDGQQVTVTSTAGLASISLKDSRFGSVSSPVPAPPVRNLRTGSGTSLVGVQGTSACLVNTITGKASSLKIQFAPGMKPTDCRQALASADGKQLLVAGEESKSAWIVDVTSKESRELSPIQIPESIRQPQ